MNKATSTSSVIRLENWSFYGLDDLSGYQRAAMLAAINYDQMHPVYVKRIFCFDGKVTVDLNKREVHFEPVTIKGWRIHGSYNGLVGFVPSRVEAKKFAKLLEEKEKFTGSDLRNVFGHHACVINRETKDITLWNIFGTNIGMGDDDYPLLDVELAHVEHGKTEAQIRRHTGHMGPIHIDEKRYTINFLSF